MRKIVMTCVVAGVVLLGGGCGGSETSGFARPATGVAASSTPVAASSGAVAASSNAASGNTTQVCAEAKALEAEFRSKATDILSRALDEDDEAKADRILDEMLPLARQYKAKFEALAKRATDQRLKDVLTAIAKDIDNENVDPTSEAARAVQNTFDTICGK